MGGVTGKGRIGARPATWSALGAGVCWASAWLVATLTAGWTAEASLALLLGGTVLSGLGGALLSGRWRRPEGEAPGPAGADILDTELERARRLGTTLAVVRFPTPGGGPGRHGDSPDVRSTLERTVRAVDRIWVAGDSVYAALPGTGRTGALQCASRVQAVVGDVGAVLAVFPDDALTSSAILGGLVFPGAPGVPLDLRDDAVEHGEGVESARAAVT